MVRDRRAVEAVAASLGAMVERDVPLGPMTTYRVGGAAALFARPSTLDELRAIGAAVRESGVPVLVVGRGSNMLVADDGFDGLAVSLVELGPSIEIDATTVTAGGAVALPVLARRTVAAGLTGFEWAVGVPGSIGGAVRMNAGGHGSDMAERLVGIERYDLLADEFRWVEVDELGLRFRGSDLADHHVVVSARIELDRGDHDVSQALLDEIVRWRREHQPGGQNAGSVFVNPVPGQVAAGELVDRLGLRGLRIGTAYVSDKHANFIQSSDGGTAADVRAVIDEVRRRVAEGTGYLLRSEVRLVGFDDDPGPEPT